MITDKKLYRSTKNKMIAGVAGGFAEFFNIDPTLVRLIFVFAGLAGPGIPFYLIAWLIMPVENKI
ncbi:MAG: PspC domain-containing protein [Patescibacteria group bacterium]|jgi:phage shock protein PspC (stress-responsive transcriptional regulator)